MIGSDIVELAQGLVSKDLANFLDGNLTNIYKHLNRLYGHRVLDILRVRVDKNASIKRYITTHFSTVGLVVGNIGFNGEYPFPADLLRPVRIEISYDGVTWTKCTIYDNALNEGSEYNDTQLRELFSEQEPRVDFNRNSYMIRPPKTTSGNISRGIYIEYEARQVDFTSSTTPLAIDQNLQDILSWDLAKLEMIVHAAKYSSQEIAIFNAEHSKMEQLFLSAYMTNLPTRKTIDFNFRSLIR